MPYIEETCRAGNTIEVCKYSAPRVHAKGEKRETKSRPTSKAQEKVNQRKAEKTLRRLMNHNFQDGDLLLRLDFYREACPEGSRQMQGMIAKAVRKLRTSFRKQGRVLKYIYVKEVGPRGGRHIHMVMSKADIDLIRAAWPYGGIHIDPLHTGGQYRKIAAYFIKYAAKTEETEGELIGKRWYGSRSLVKPKVEKKVIQARTFRERAKKVDGYYLEKDTEVSGICEWTGYAYYSYTLLRMKIRKGAYDNSGLP